MATICRKDFISQIAKNLGCTLADASNILEALLESLVKALRAGDTIMFQKFGTFKVVQRKARVARNLHTGKPIKVPAKKAVKFVPSKEILNG